MVTARRTLRRLALWMNGERVGDWSISTGRPLECPLLSATTDEDCSVVRFSSWACDDRLHVPFGALFYQIHSRCVDLHNGASRLLGY